MLARSRVIACAFVALAIAGAATPAFADENTTTVTTRGHSVTVTPVTALNPAGQRIVVTGRGFDPRVGIYVSLCLVPPQGSKPTPCGGGVNTSGTSPASAWVSSNPPPYGQALAIPYRKGGSFRVVLTVSSIIGDLDCRSSQCAIVTRADHTRPGDRRFDVIVPVKFS